jgi:hypothetical protein
LSRWGGHQGRRSEPDGAADYATSTSSPAAGAISYVSWKVWPLLLSPRPYPTIPVKVAGTAQAKPWAVASLAPLFYVERSGGPAARPGALPHLQHLEPSRVHAGHVVDRALREVPRSGWLQFPLLHRDDDQLGDRPADKGNNGGDIGRMGQSSGRLVT